MMKNRPASAIHCALLAFAVLLWPQSASEGVPLDLFAVALVLMSNSIAFGMFVDAYGNISPAWRLKVRLMLMFGFATATLGCLRFPDELSHHLLLTGTIAVFFTTLLINMISTMVQREEQ